MRLLHFDANGKICRTKDETQDIPSYAILSHTWLADNEEISFADLTSASQPGIAGFQKIKFCGEQALRDRLSHFWVDTCCIDKANHSELAEAITSMFRWYQNASHCYVYMSDVSLSGADDASLSWKVDFRRSRWFTRGWTLQELLAPRSVKFYSKEWRYMGDRKSLESLIHEVTAIPVTALRGAALSNFSVQDRLSWAHNRTTTRKEDKAYCLQGLFGVFIPLIYGEEEHAFARLKKAIEEQNEVRETESDGRDFHIKQKNTELNNVDALDVYKKTTVSEALSLIRFRQLDNRLANIAPPQHETCLWLLESKAYREWVDPLMVSRHGGFLWIKGKPGCGKSTLAKFLLKRLEAVPGSTILSFFFNARGTDLEKNINGLYRSLIVQILNSHADSRQHWNELFPAAPVVNEQLLASSIGLKDLLRQVLRLVEDRNLTIIIDALDEGDEDEIRDMITFLEELGTAAVVASRKLHILFASRYYPHITLPKAVELRIEDQQGHAEDIKKYVTQQLHMTDSEESRILRKTIQKKALGVFIWVVLVVHILNKAYDRGQVHNLDKKLEAMPDNLYDLFRDSLARDKENLDQTRLCIQWVSVAQRPLKQEELYFAILSGTEPDALRTWDPEVITSDTMSRFILSASKGLVEVTRTENRIAQFIHESVRNFLYDGGLSDLMSCSQEELWGLTHDNMKQACHAYLQSNILRSGIEDKLPGISFDESLVLRARSIGFFPFLRYSVKYVLSHAEYSQAWGQGQKKFLKNFHLEHWVRLNNIVATSELKRYPIGISLLYVLAQRDHSRLLRLITGDQLHKREQGGMYGNPIFAAIASNSQAAFEALLAAEKRSNPTGCMFPYRIPRPLLFLGMNASSKLASRCLAFYDFGPDIHENRLGTWIFMQMAAVGHEEGILALLKKGIDVNIKGSERHKNALEAAAEFGREDMLQKLLALGAHVNSPGTSALSVAASMGYEKATQLLIEAGANLDSQTVTRRQALYAASRAGHANVVKLLLAAGAGVNSQTNTRNMALYAASSAGHTNVVKLLLAAGAGVNSQTNTRNMALYAASSAGHTNVVKLLLAAGADGNVLGNGIETALQAACRRAHENVVEMLLDAGANVEASGGKHGNALQAVCRTGHWRIVRLLIAYGADIDAPTGMYRTAIDAAKLGSEECQVASQRSDYELTLQILLNAHKPNFFEARRILR